MTWNDIGIIIQVTPWWVLVLVGAELVLDMIALIYVVSVFFRQFGGD